MNKNKLTWTFALIFVFIATLPIAYAQAFTGNSLFLILINAAIVGVILFLLQSFLIPGKDTKEKTAVWVAIVVGSLLIGWLFGSQDYIWKHPVIARFFSIYVLVNAIIIGTALYFLSGFLDINKKLGGSPEGKGGLEILIFLISAIFAVQIGNQWIWQKAVVQQFIAYLFGAQGILNPAPPEYRLWAFLAVGTLLAFFFQGYLLQGVAGGTKINYALAILIASSVARAGISFASVVLLGEAIFTIVLAKALQGTAPQPKGIPGHWILAAFLVGWASAAMTYGTEYQGWLATIVGAPLWALGLITVGPAGVAARPTGVGGWIWWIGKMGLGALLIIGLPILLFGFVIGRGKRRAKWWNEGLIRLQKHVNNFISRHEILNRILSKFFGMRDQTLENEIPSKLKELRFELYNLMNWMLRYDIYYSKYHIFRRTQKIIEELETGSKDVPGLQTRAPIRESAAESIKGLVEGSEIVEDRATGIWNLMGKTEVDAEGNIVETTVPRMGFGRQHWLIYYLALKLKETLEKNLTVEPTTDVGKQLEIGIQEFRTYLDAQKGHIEDFYEKRYKSGVIRFGIANVLRSYRLYFLDMYNLYGQYKRGYWFAKLDAIPDLYEYKTISKDGGITKSIELKKDNDGKYKVRYIIKPPERIRYNQILNKTERSNDENRFIESMKREYYSFDGGRYGSRANYEEDTNYHLELDLFGRCLSEWNAIAIDGKTETDIPYIRRFRREDMWELYKVNAPPRPRYATMFGWAVLDWENWVKDMGQGSFHPYSKRLSDYEFITEEGLLDYSKATFKRPLAPQEVGFDREGLKAFHKFVYWGRRKYYDTTSSNLYNPDQFCNPYPSLSLGGLWGFIKRVAIRKIEEPDIAKRFLREFQMEYAQLDVLEKGGEKSER